MLIQRLAPILLGLSMVAMASGTTERTTSQMPSPAPVVSSPVDRADDAERWVSYVAEATVPQVSIYQSADAPAATQSLDNPQPSGAPLVFLVQNQQPEWLEVLLPVRPNGSSGWIRRADVTLSQHDFRIVVELAAHRLTVYQGDGIFHQETIGVGTRDAPTPGGRYYTKELIEPVDETGRYIPDGPYGPYAYGLSGFSNVLTSFAGGEGVIGIHGTNDPSTLGKDVSHGCIRMSNEGISRLAHTLPLGVPVEIQ